MLIALDIDEVLADFMNGALPFLNRLYGSAKKREEFSTYNLWNIFGGTREEAVNNVHRFYAHDSFAQLKPVEHSQEEIRKISNNHTLVAVTSRPAHIESKTREWIERNYGKVIKKIYFTNQWNNDDGNSTTKADICLEIGANVLIEDHVDYVTDCILKNERMYGIMPNCPWNQTQNLHPRIHRVNDWKEIPQIIESIKN